MTRKELVAEILTAVRKYDDLGLVDMITLNEDIKNQLRRFGSNVMEKRTKVLEVVGGRARLPEGFYKLNFAATCYPYSVEPEMEVDDSWRTDSYVKRIITNEYEWDNESQSHYKKAYKEIIESKKIRGSQVKVKHGISEVLGLTKGVSKEYISDSCVNKLVVNTRGSASINLTNTHIFTNFSEGHIFIDYQSLPEEDGDLVIPDNVNLQQYLKYYSISKILESIWLNDETTNLEGKISYYRSESLRLESLAHTSVKFEGLGTNWDKKFARRNKNYIRKFYGGI